MNTLGLGLLFMRDDVIQDGRLGFGPTLPLRATTRSAVLPDPTLMHKLSLYQPPFYFIIKAQRIMCIQEFLDNSPRLEVHSTSLPQQRWR